VENVTVEKDVAAVRLPPPLLERKSFKLSIDQILNNNNNQNQQKGRQQSGNGGKTAGEKKKKSQPIAE
jgi:hypothetical protein